MHTGSKLAAPSGTELKHNVFEVVDSLKRVLLSSPSRRPPRQLKDLDTWSDQTEVAFYEEGHARRS